MVLEIKCKDHYDAVMKFAENTGRIDSFKKQLAYLDSYAEHGDSGKTRCLLTYDSAPYSFNFVMQRRGKDGEYTYWFNGGLLFHGRHDGFGSGVGPTFAVTVEPTDDWSIHT